MSVIVAVLGLVGGAPAQGWGGHRVTIHRGLLLADEDTRKPTLIIDAVTQVMVEAKTVVLSSVRHLQT